MSTTTVVTDQPQRGGPATPFADCWISEEARAAAQRVLASGWVTTGTECQAFESEFAAYLGARHAVSVSSCTAGLELALRSLRLDPGSAVLTSTMTFCGAVHAIEHAGLRPVLVDVDPATGMPTPGTVARARELCGEQPAAMVLVHWAGDTFDRAGLADAAGLPEDRVVEDAAHALGSEHAGAAVGTGPNVCFSFYATKNLPIGEGGMVTTDDPDRASWIRRARLHGMSQDAWRRYLPGGSWRYDVAETGL
jgi:dTDP-4-amino-4,6-dideoxygalactose transaminase